MLAIFLNSFILFLITIDTIGNLPFFISLTEGADIKKKNQIAIKSVIIAFLITILFAYLGKYLLDAIGVNHAPTGQRDGDCLANDDKQPNLL